MVMYYPDYMRFRLAYEKLLAQGITPDVDNLTGVLHKPFDPQDIQEALDKIQRQADRKAIKERVNFDTILEAYKRLHEKGIYQTIHTILSEMDEERGSQNEVTRCLGKIRAQYPEYRVRRYNSSIREYVVDAYNRMQTNNEKITIDAIHKELGLNGIHVHRTAVCGYLIELRGKTSNKGKPVKYNKEMVWNTIKEMEADGVKLTALKIRQTMGGGTHRTITIFLKEYLEDKKSQ